MSKLNSFFETVPVAEVLKRVSASGNECIGENINHNGRSKTVLVVDDERVIADTLATILQGAGYEAIVSYNAEDGLKQCEAGNPELVLTDVVMPGMNGVEMAVHIRERHPSCKVVLISGQASVSDLLEDAHQRGYDFELLSKPIHPEDLLSKLAA
jgi:DNA-binding NtrC family response regulator